MAGRGPAPKQTRQRRNAPARGDWVDLALLPKPVLPELAEYEGEWGQTSVVLWEIWRNDPVSALWSKSDVAFALDTLMIRQEALVRSANEVRLRMESLGLTPKGRRDLRLRLPDEPAEDEPEAPKAEAKRKIPDAL